MMTTLESVICIGLFVVPGFLALSISNAIVPLHSKKSLDSLVRCFAYSLVQYALFGWAFVLVYDSTSVPMFFLASVPMVLAIGTASGLAIGWMRAKGLLGKLLKWASVNTNMAPSAWDYKFSSIDDHSWLTVHMSNGETICGLYASNSFASSISGDCRDLYLEKYYIVADGQWSEAIGTDGVYISSASIVSIEFYRGED